MSKNQTWKLVLLLALILFFCACSKQKNDLQKVVEKIPAMPVHPITETDHKNCIEAARKALGSKAEMLKCGHLSGTNDLETIAAIRVPGLKDDQRGIPISKLMILRQGKSQWDTELKMFDHETTNPVGYVGIYNIDDSDPFSCYRVDLTGSTSGSILVSYMTPDGKVDEEGWPAQIGWNPAVGRFQEIPLGTEAFEPEVKSPKHIRTQSKVKSTNGQRLTAND